MAAWETVYMIMSPHSRKPLQRPEQPSWSSLWCRSPGAALRTEPAKGCRPLSAGTCNTSHSQLITSVFVSNLMETELKINCRKPRGAQGEVWGRSGWGWTGWAWAAQRLPGPVGNFTSCWTLFSATCVGFPLFLPSPLCYTCGDGAGGEVTKGSSSWERQCLHPVHSPQHEHFY